MKIFLLFFVIFASLLAASLFLEPFSLSKDFVQDSAQHVQRCKRVSECNLQEGDILLRRYVSSHTLPLVSIYNFYFTHSAIYSGTNSVIEAQGNSLTDEDEVLEWDLETSGWMDEQIESFAVLRLSKNQGRKVVSMAREVAADKKVKFGFVAKNEYSCADFIFSLLSRVSTNLPKPSSKIITPDYLFFLGGQKQHVFIHASSVDL